LKWACFSSPPPATSSDPGSSTTSAVAVPHTPLVLSQGAAPGTVLKAHTVIDISMRHCPQ